MVANQTCPAEGAKRVAKDGPGFQGWNRLAHQPPVRFYPHKKMYTICADKRKRGLDKNESEVVWRIPGTPGCLGDSSKSAFSWEHLDHSPGLIRISVSTTDKIRGPICKIIRKFALLFHWCKNLLVVLKFGNWNKRKITSVWILTQHTLLQGDCYLVMLYLQLYTGWHTFIPVPLPNLNF